MRLAWFTGAVAPPVSRRSRKRPLATFAEEFRKPTPGCGLAATELFPVDNARPRARARGETGLPETISSGSRFRDARIGGAPGSDSQGRPKAQQRRALRAGRRREDAGFLLPHSSSSAAKEGLVAPKDLVGGSTADARMPFRSLRQSLLQKFSRPLPLSNKTTEKRATL